MRMYLMLLNCTPKNGSDDNLFVVYFTTKPDIIGKVVVNALNLRGNLQGFSMASPPIGRSPTPGKGAPRSGWGLSQEQQLLLHPESCSLGAWTCHVPRRADGAVPHNGRGYASSFRLAVVPGRGGAGASWWSALSLLPRPRLGSRTGAQHFSTLHVASSGSELCAQGRLAGAAPPSPCPPSPFPALPSSNMAAAASVTGLVTWCRRL